MFCVKRSKLFKNLCFKTDGYCCSLVHVSCCSTALHSTASRHNLKSGDHIDAMSQSMVLTGESAAAATFSTAVCVYVHALCVILWMWVCVHIVHVCGMCHSVCVCACVRMRRYECVGVCV